MKLKSALDDIFESSDFFDAALEVNLTFVSICSSSVYVEKFYAHLYWIIKICRLLNENIVC